MWESPLSIKMEPEKTLDCSPLKDWTTDLYQGVIGGIAKAAGIWSV